MQNYDVVIVGAGPSGSTAGYLLKKHGYKTLIIDKKEFPREKLCGGLITQKSVDLLENIFSSKFVSSVVEDKKNKVKIFFKDKHINSINTKVPFYLVDRKNFDYSLLKKFLEIGGDFKGKTVFKNINLSKNQIELSTGEIIGFKYIIGADGALSKTRKLIEPDFKPSGYCLETFLPSKTYGQYLEIYFGDLNSGYGWIFPRKNTEVVGIGADYKENKNSFNNQYEGLVGKLSQFYEKPKGAFIPFGEFVEKPVKDNKLFLIGDAAGLVDPVTGEGIYYALKSGEMVANSIINSNNKTTSEDIYLKLIKDIQKEIKLRKLVRKIVYGKLNFLFFNSLGKIKPLVRYVCDNIISR